MIHICSEEIYAAMAAFASWKIFGPYVRTKLITLAGKVRARLRRRKPHCCNEDHHV